MAVDYYLQLANVPGESVATNNSGQIQVQSWSWGGTNTSTVGATTGSGAGRVSLSDLNMTIEFDKSAPKLLNGLTAGTHYATATLTAVKAGAGNSPYMTLALTELFISSLQLGAGGEVPSVSLSMTYKSYTFTYYIQAADGTVSTGGTTSYDTTTHVTT